MKLNGDDVRAIAYEARLSLTNAELEGAVSYINNFLEMAGRFKELDLKNVEPFRFAESRECPLREDKPEPFAQAPDILAARCAADAGAFFKVPRIMEE
ncbi:MAG: aspartyl/glutamyl-tRNA amidotransferase subunit C [Synergistaceae bacterium]|nr:aspartyl/glutamyl-tRNA amidotransferase subunit C [Synergistaceae bacterium]